MLTLTNYFN